MSPLQKVIKNAMPLRHQDSKTHKELILNNIFLVKLCALVARKTLFKVDSNS